MSTVRHLIDSNAEQYCDQVFLFAPEPGLQMTFGELQHHARHITQMLDSMGTVKGDKVAFLMPNGYWTTVIFLSVIYSGRVVVPLNAVSGDSALMYVIDHSDCKVIFIEPGFQHKFSSVLDTLNNDIQIISTNVDTGFNRSGEVKLENPSVDINADDIAVLIYTSGTTGQPKGVLLSQNNVIAGGNNTAQAHGLTKEDRTMCVLPLYHINAEMVSIMAPLVSAGSVVMPHRFSTQSFWKTIADFECSWFSVVPTIVAYLIEHADRESFNRDVPGGFPKLRFGRSASAPLAPEMHKAFEKKFNIPMIETMGLSETAAQILSNPIPPARGKYGSPGVAVGNEAKIIDADGCLCKAGVEGELMIRGENVTPGYYKNPQATHTTIEDDGWLHTGDIAKCDEDGFYFITGRIKELIIKGGENIAPREIDEALYEHPKVLEAAGFCIPDPHYGQEVMACVALKEGTECTEQELLLLTEKHLGSFKCPKRIFFMDELPKGPSGKIQRLKLPDLISEKKQDG